MREVEAIRPVIMQYRKARIHKPCKGKVRSKKVHRWEDYLQPVVSAVSSISHQETSSAYADDTSVFEVEVMRDSRDQGNNISSDFNFEGLQTSAYELENYVELHQLSYQDQISTNDIETQDSDGTLNAIRSTYNPHFHTDENLWWLDAIPLASNRVNPINPKNVSELINDCVIL
ncbi:hypothetical protein TWF694_001556 [Orbilia ellipsospora]